MSKRKNVSQRQLDANRRNAKKSTGPKTQAGLDMSKFNALKHGLTATAVCIPGEHRPDHDERRKQYLAHFQPIDLVEFDLVDDLVAIRWRKERAIRHEVTLVKLEIASHRAENANEGLVDVSEGVESTLATQSLADQASFRLLERYEGRLNRDFARTLNMLRQVQADRPPSDGPLPVYPPVEQPLPATDRGRPKPPTEPENSTPPNETIPTNEHPQPRPVATFAVGPRRPKTTPPAAETALDTPFTKTAELFHAVGSVNNLL